MTDAVVTSENATRGPKWLRYAVLVLFALLFAFDLFEALTNLFGALELSDARNAFRESQDLAPIAVPWAVLLANVAAPVLGFVAAWWLGRRRRPGAQAVIFLVGLAVVAAFTLTLVALARTVL